jgi:hypothetical protein
MKQKTFKVDVRWHAHAVVTVRAKDAKAALKKVADRGLPWDKAVEADDGDGYSIGLEDDGNE